MFLNTLISLINVTSRLPILENSTLQETKVLPASLLSSLQNLQYSYRTFNNLTETNNDFPRGHFELYIFILAQKLTEKVQLILQLLHPYTFIPTYTVIREMRVDAQEKKSLQMKAKKYSNTGFINLETKVLDLMSFFG